MDINERDQRDSGRKVAPLKATADALIIDTTKMGIEEVVQQIVAEAVKRIQK